MNFFLGVCVLALSVSAQSDNQAIELAFLAAPNIETWRALEVDHQALQKEQAACVLEKHDRRWPHACARELAVRRRRGWIAATELQQQQAQLEPHCLSGAISVDEKPHLADESLFSEACRVRWRREMVRIRYMQSE